jgi:hypothetical protein
MLPLDMPALVFQRLSVCVSQSLATMLTALIFDVINRSDDVLYFDLLQICGYLCHFECLLSTAGDENGMLDDHVIAIELLNRVSIELYSGQQEMDDRSLRSEPRVTSIEGALTDRIIVHVNAGCYLTASDGTGKNSRCPICFDIFPVLISQGINEQQTIANAVGHAGRQREINRKAISRFTQ